jgi:hypothetical protein
MKIELIEIAGFKAALESLRLPFKKECRSVCEFCLDEEFPNNIYYSTEISVNGKDLMLSQSLIKKGNDHAKFVRGIQAYLKITAPRYIWSELDTYSIGVTKLPSESTMHTLLKEEVTYDNFEFGTDRRAVNNFIEAVRGTKELIQEYPEVIKSSKRALKQILPEGYLQTRIICYSYQALRNIYFQRRKHDLPEWSIFCQFIETLPLAKELITIE